jgi:hypothetical protein
MNNSQPTFWGITLKTIVVHTVTYFLMGILAFFFFDYSSKFADPNVRVLMRQTNETLVMAGPLFQPIRGFLFAVVFYLLREVLFGRKNGWLIMWSMLVVVGVLSPFGAAPASIEGMIYTTLPLSFHIIGLPEVLLQPLLLSVILYYWVNRPEKKWLNWVLGVAFFLVLLFPTLGLLVGPTQP